MVDAALLLAERRLASARRRPPAGARRAGWPAPRRATRAASRGSRRTIGTVLARCGSCSRPAGAPAPAMRTTDATLPADSPAARGLLVVHLEAPLRPAATRRTSRRRRRRGCARVIDRTVPRQLEAPRRVRAVDLGDERLQHRRARRHLDHLDRAPSRGGDRLERWREPLGDRRGSARRARPCPTSITCRSARFGLAPQEVVPHQAVERVRRRRAGVALDARDRLVAAAPRRRAPTPRRRSSRAACPRACRTITCSSLLLSNGSIFTVTSPSGTSATAARSSTATSARNPSRGRGPRDERPHHAPVERRQAILRLVLPAVRPARAAARPPTA